MYPCCGYDPGFAAYLSSMDDEGQGPVADVAVMDMKLSLICLAVVGLVHGIAVLVT